MLLFCPKLKDFIWNLKLIQNSGTRPKAYFLSPGQFTFSAVACVIAAAIYLSFNEQLGDELTSWICIAVPLPFAALGFISYQGMAFEKIVVVAFYYFLLNRKDFISKPINIYYETTKGIISTLQMNGAEG